jgi:hypothetical protein
LSEEAILLPYVEEKISMGEAIDPERHTGIVPVPGQVRLADLPVSTVED